MTPEQEALAVDERVRLAEEVKRLAEMAVTRHERDVLTRAAAAVAGVPLSLVPEKQPNDVHLAEASSEAALFSTADSPSLDAFAISDAMRMDDGGEFRNCASHHYTADNVRHLIERLRFLADPARGSTQADWDAIDWRGWCNVLARVMAALAEDVPHAEAFDCNRSGG